MLGFLSSSRLPSPILRSATNAYYRVQIRFSLLSSKYAYCRFSSTQAASSAHAIIAHHILSRDDDFSDVDVPSAENVERQVAFTTPLQLYNQRVEQGVLKDDPHQRRILKSMEFLFEQLKEYHPPNVLKPCLQSAQSHTSISSFIKSLFGASVPFNDYNSSVPHGIYLYGDVGCGKTMLMDLFYQTIPPHLSKKRLHFHQFMQKLHKRSHELKTVHGEHQNFDVMPTLAYELSKQATVLCFDEFQVTDVADAMLLRRLIDLSLRSDHGLVLFATSNRAPDDLYINGIQRESFIPCIEEIKSKTNVIHLDSPTDYRRIPRPLCSVYFSPRKGATYHSKECRKQRKHHIDSWYSYFSQGHRMEYRVPIRLWGRELMVPKCSPPYVAGFSFKQLCGKNYAAGDYLALASQFESIIVTDIPYLSIDSRDEVRRFITFLDAVYDNHCRLAVTAAAPFSEIFVEPEDINPDDGFELSEKGRKKLEESRKLDESLSNSNSSRNEQSEIYDPLVKEHGFDKSIARQANLFAELDEERFAFARALSRLKQMRSLAWVENVSAKGMTDCLKLGKHHMPKMPNC